MVAAFLAALQAIAALPQIFQDIRDLLKAQQQAEIEKLRSEMNAAFLAMAQANTTQERIDAIKNIAHSVNS